MWPTNVVQRNRHSNHCPDAPQPWQRPISKKHLNIDLNEHIYIYRYYIYSLKHVYIMCVFVCVCLCVSIGCIYELYWRLKVDIILHRAPNFQATILRFHQWKKNIHTKITQRQKVDFSGRTFAPAPILQPLTTKKKKAVLHPKTKWIPPIRRVPLHPNGGGCPCWKCHPRRLSQMED